MSNIHNTFGSLGVRRGDTYNVSDDCLTILEEILRKLAIEDQTLRTFRRAVGFGQNIRKDLIPLLIYVKDDTKICDATKIIDATIKILANLTVPVECLLSIDAVSRTDVGRHTIFELDRLLTTSKEAFTDSRSTKAVVDHIKHVVEHDINLNVQQCDSINNCLLLLTNILHIPEGRSTISNCPLAHSSMQNEIIWNLFTQNIDKIVIYLMSCPHKMYWGVTLVQFIALMYKDQHVGTLQKLLNLWLETSLSESSEDNESNTSPPDQGSGDCSPTITSDPTSDSSDNGGGGNRNSNTRQTANNQNKANTTEVVRAVQNRSKQLATMKRMQSTETDNSTSSGVSSMAQSCDSSSHPNNQTFTIQDTHLDKVEHTQQIQQQNILNNSPFQGKNTSLQTEISDCGYATQVENQESISTSSNEDDQPHQKPVHQKPHTFQKMRYNNQKSRVTVLDKKELRRKKLVKRSKTNTINIKGLMHHKPTDEDISNILKEFTVDFLLKGYGTLVHDLHSQLLSNFQLRIDTSHFFWLVTYFLKFATQLELDFEHVSPVLCYEIISYLVFQGVWLYEELEINSKIPDYDIKPCLRRLHLVVTAIREFIQAVETYYKLTHLSDDDRNALMKLQMQLKQTDELKCLFLLLLRQYNPNLQSKQYLQDLIITNHIYLLFLENVSKTEKSSLNDIMEHLKQFATVEIMRQYGLLLENFTENGEFINSCVFTMMHHIGGDLSQISTLFQPSILKTFSQIWETDYEICDDWSDLIEYVIHKFMNTNRGNHRSSIASTITPLIHDREGNVVSTSAASPQSSNKNEWTQEEKDTLLDFYIESRGTYDAISTIKQKYEEIGTQNKTQHAVIQELLQQNIITKEQFDDFMKIKSIDVFCDARVKIQFSEDMDTVLNPCSQDNPDIKTLIQYLHRENNGSHVLWLQNIVMEACFVKLVIENANIPKTDKNIMEPTVYYNALLRLPVPLVSWTFEQSNTMNHPPFVSLLHKLGFYLPVDTGKIFVRIPNFWTADYLFTIAEQLGPIDSGKVKFDISLLKGEKKAEYKIENCNAASIIDGYCKFSMTELKQTPSMVRFSPNPNSTNRIENVLRVNIKPIVTNAMDISSNHELLITIPEVETLPYALTPPKLAIVGHSSKLLPLRLLSGPIDMEISANEEDEADILNDDIEQYSETASVASDLTRMCVSDEEEKVIFLEPQKKSLKCK